MSDERHSDRVHLEDAVLNIGGDIGALVLYTGPEYRECEIEVSRVGETRRVHTAIHERRVGHETVYAGLYPDLSAGDYHIWADDPSLPDRVTIVGGEVATLDWRRDHIHEAASRSHKRRAPAHRQVDNDLTGLPRRGPDRDNPKPGGR